MQRFTAWPTIFLTAFLTSLAAPEPVLAQAPANDAFAAAQVVDPERERVEGTTEGATKEPGEPNHAGNPGGKSVWYRWTAPRDGGAIFTTENSGEPFDTLLAIYQGDRVDALTLIAADDDSGIGTTSRLSFRATAGAVYHVAVDGFGGKSGAFTLTWTLAPRNDDFATATVVAGSNGLINMTTEAATREPGEPEHANNPPDAGSVWFRWTAPFNGRVTFSAVNWPPALYTGATLASLVPVRGTWSGERFAFTATAGTTYSLAVTSSDTLRWARPPANDDFAAPFAIGGAAGRISGSNAGASGESGEPGHWESDPDASVWYRWRAPRSGRAFFSTAGDELDTVLALYTGRQLRSLRPLGKDDDGGPGLNSLVAFTALRGRLYRIAVDGYAGQEGRFRLVWRVGRASGAPPPAITGRE